MRPKTETSNPRLKERLADLQLRMRGFRADEDGSTTVESVLWLPVFLVFFVLIADVSFVFHRQSQMLRAVQDGNRALSVGRLSSTDEVETFIENRLASMTNSAEVSTQLATGVIHTEVRVPVEHLTAVGMFDFLAQFDVGVTSQQFIEY